MSNRRRKIVAVCAMIILQLGCATTPPKNQTDLCSIFYQKEGWYTAALAAQKKWDAYSGADGNNPSGI